MMASTMQGITRRSFVAGAGAATLMAATAGSLGARGARADAASGTGVSFTPGTYTGKAIDPRQRPRL